MGAVRSSMLLPTGRRREQAFIICWKLREEGRPMPDLSIDFCGVRSPNPFSLASSPPTNTAYQVMRAFDAGWRGAAWNTIGYALLNTASSYRSDGLQNLSMPGLQHIERIRDTAIS